jgi:hypothetical protein
MTAFYLALDAVSFTPGELIVLVAVLLLAAAKMKRRTP